MNCSGSMNWGIGLDEVQDHLLPQCHIWAWIIYHTEATVSYTVDCASRSSPFSPQTVWGSVAQFGGNGFNQFLRNCYKGKWSPWQIPEREHSAGSPSCFGSSWGYGMPRQIITKVNHHSCRRAGCSRLCQDSSVRGRNREKIPTDLWQSPHQISAQLKCLVSAGHETPNWWSCSTCPSSFCWLLQKGVL